ncbi:MAG: mechanosensitive ion channel family protein [Chloroflexi bacterium CFX7]|nr:mechanosensitive ion channel family protein [Chloroflexi bacterium CFX7]RIL04211.1 MAG: hypothetical protein DCC78_01135 [bacterium]
MRRGAPPAPELRPPGAGLNSQPLFLVPGSWDEWREWLESHGPDIAGIAIGLVLVRFLFHRLFARLLREAANRAARARREDPEAVRKRAETLLSTLDWLFTIFLVFVGSALLLDQFDIQVSALIAGVSVIGIAVGLGTQTLVKDVINGFFILVEGQYAVGDTVTVGGATGEVIEINPRRTVVRDSDGNVHSIPNSTITVATNLTPALSRIRVDIEVPFRESEAARALVAEVASALSRTMGDSVTSPARVAHQRMVTDTDVCMTIIADVRPPDRWEVEAELRRSLKRRFEAAKAGLAFPVTGSGSARALPTS